MEWLSNFAIKKPVTTIIILIAMVFLGAVSVVGIPSELMPELKIPYVTVVVGYSGVAPEEIEDLITSPIEGAIEGVEGIDKMTSYSSEGRATILVGFKWGVDLDKKVEAIKEKMTKVRGRLPKEIDEPIVSKLDVMANDQVMSLNLAGDDLIEVKRVAKDVMKPKLERITGVASIDIFGGLSKEILLKVSPARLQAYGLNYNSIIDAVRNANMNMPAGKLKEGDKEFLVRTIGKIEDVETIKNILLYDKKGSTLYLKDVVDVMVGTGERQSYNREDGKESVSLIVIKQTGGNAVSISDTVRERFKDYEKVLPRGMKLSIARDTATYIKDSMEMVRDAALIGLVLSVVILMVFLKNWRATLIIAAAIPICIIFTFYLIKQANLTMNLLTLGGLALGVGMLVDNSIIVLENIYRHFSDYKKPAMEAARDGSSEIGLAILASTSCHLIVFLPVAFANGIAGEIFRGFAFTISFSLGASMIVALTFVPMISSKILKEGNEMNSEGKFFERIKHIYSRIIEKAINRRKTTIAIAVGIFFLSLVMAAAFIGMEFFPQTDKGTYMITATLPKGLEVEKANRIAKEIEMIVSNKKYLTEKYAAQVSKDSVIVNVDIGHKDKRKEKVTDVMERVRKEVEKIPDINVKLSAQSMGGGGNGAPVQVTLSGDDYSKLIDISKKIKEKVKSVKGVVDVSSSFDGGNPELRIEIDREKVARYDIGVAYVSSMLGPYLKGTTPMKIQNNGEEIDVVVQLDEDFRDSISKIEEVDIPLPAGGQIKVKDVAKVILKEGPSTIIREDKVKSVTISGNNQGRDLGSITKDLTALLAKESFPDGYGYKFGGDQKQMMETMGSLATALLISIILMYMILASQFESFIEPLIIMVAVPFGVVGVIFGLLVTGMSVSVTVMIGIIMLGGIVVNNSIVLIDYIHVLRAREIPRDEAIIQAGKTRLRPILMTVATAAIGFVPLALGIGAGADFYQPLAVSVIFGLLISTFLTLIVVPSIYAVVDDMRVYLATGKKSGGSTGKRKRKVSTIVTTEAQATHEIKSAEEILYPKKEVKIHEETEEKE